MAVALLVVAELVVQLLPLVLAELAERSVGLPLLRRSSMRLSIPLLRVHVRPSPKALQACHVLR